MGKVVGFEISSQEPEKAAEFYSKVFGWEIAEPQWNYQAVKTAGGVNGGISGPPDDHPAGTRIQIEVDSIDDAISKAKDLGATIVKDKMDFDTFYLAYLIDPTGVHFGLTQIK
ncbi:VOC family protein [Paenibacillus psychroresistens]|uniref:VOC family protein n=1 Tax=Paenibacillus psychroresistens TaxID=1778678 RepID=A0A6B8RF72_9BACL|nr:VOC family protein [Paenibacillus psychroresistens]QGQ94215.1 VOC family protein [Paenibacillus psychroresistens]